MDAWYLAQSGAFEGRLTRVEAEGFASSALFSGQAILASHPPNRRLYFVSPDAVIEGGFRSRPIRDTQRTSGQIRQIEGMSGRNIDHSSTGLSPQYLMLAIWKLARGQDRLQPQPCMATRSKRCVLITGQSLVVPENFFSQTSKKC